MNHFQTCADKKCYAVEIRYYFILFYTEEKRDKREKKIYENIFFFESFS